MLTRLLKADLARGAVVALTLAGLSRYIDVSQYGAHCQHRLSDQPAL